MPLPSGRWLRPVVLGALVSLVVPVSALAAPAASPADPYLTAAEPPPPPVTTTAHQLADGTARAVYTLPGLRTSDVTFDVVLRHQDDGTGYASRAVVAPDGQITVDLRRWTHGQLDTLASRVLPTKAVDGRALTLEGSVTGSDAVVLRVRAWVGSDEVPAWQQSAVDRSDWRITAAGSAGPSDRLSLAAGSRSETVAARRFSTASRPTASTTGVPAGTKLKVHHGNIVVTKDGTRLDRLDVHGFVIVQAKDVRITRSIIRGGTHPRTAVGLITNYGYPGLVISDVRLKPDHLSVLVDGIKGWDFTARRVHVSGNVDSVKIHGDNVRVESSLLENTTWFAHDPYQDGGPTHNDNVQVLEGHDIVITGNTLRGSQNFAVLAQARLGAADVTVTDNWLDGGHCTVKLEGFGTYPLNVDLATNTFGPNRAVSYCLVQATDDVAYQARDNLTSAEAAPVTVYRGR